MKIYKKINLDKIDWYRGYLYNLRKRSLPSRLEKKKTEEKEIYHCYHIIDNILHRENGPSIIEHIRINKETRYYNKSFFMLGEEVKNSKEFVFKKMKSLGKKLSLKFAFVN